MYHVLLSSHAGMPFRRHLCKSTHNARHCLTRQQRASWVSIDDVYTAEILDARAKRIVSELGICEFIMSSDIVSMALAMCAENPAVIAVLAVSPSHHCELTDVQCRDMKMSYPSWLTQT